MSRTPVSRRRRTDAVELTNEPDVELESEVDIERVRHRGGAPPDAPGPEPGMTIEGGGTRIVSEEERLRMLEDGSVERRLDRREHEPPRRRIVGGWGASAVSLALLVAILAALAAVWALGGEEDVSVPTVVGMPVDEAVAKLDEAGLSPNLTGGPNDRPAGTVAEQDPAAGATVSEGSRVSVLVSEGPDEVDIPNATGLDEATARDRLASAGLDVRVVEVFSDDAEGTVVAQSPAAGESASPDTSVRLNVSKGTGRVVVPSLVGEQRDAAEQRLAELDLEANVVAVPSDEPEGVVVAQNPTSGEVGVGSSVRLNVSSGQ